MLVIFCLLFKLKDAFHFPRELFIGLKMGKLGWDGREGTLRNHCKKIWEWLGGRGVYFV